jgi:hypothetical protein
MPAPDAPVLQFRAAEPARQRRWTVLLRALLAIPLLLVVGLYGALAEVATVLAWFVAIVTGRNPFHEFVAGYLRMSARVTGYLYLLTDQYPPFSSDSEPEYPITVAIEDGPLGRASVFFRLILAVPAALVASVAGFGLGLVGLIGWLVTLFTGELPASLHGAITATTRFSLRLSAYVLLLQNPYPRGLFGDGTAASPPADGTGGPTEPAPVTPEATGATAGEGAVLDHLLPATSDATAPAPSWRLSLTRGARRVLLAQIVFGAVAYVAYVAVIAALVGSIDTPQSWSNDHGAAVSRLYDSTAGLHADLAGSTANWTTIVAACATVQGELSDLNTVPVYPQAHANAQLIEGVLYVSVADGECLRVGAAGPSASERATLASYLSLGERSLSAFLLAIPEPSNGF